MKINKKKLFYVEGAWILAALLAGFIAGGIVGHFLAIVYLIIGGIFASIGYILED